MKTLSGYNKKISRKWEAAANHKQSQLFFALATNDQKETFLFWDNARGNAAILDYLKQVVKMLENNPNANYSSLNNEKN